MNNILSHQDSRMSGSSQSSNAQSCRCVDHYFERKPKLKLETETTNKQFYKPLPIEKPQKFEVPKVKQRHYEPGVLESSYKSQYIPPSKEAINRERDSLAQSRDLANSYLQNKPKVPFYSETEYKKTFVKNDIKVQRPPEYQYQPKNVKFEGQSSYKAQFVPKQSSSELASVGSNIVSPQQYLAKKPQVPFQGSSSYKETFRTPEIKVEKPAEYVYKKPVTKFQGSSSYKDSFVKPPKQAFKSDAPECPVHPGKMAFK